MVPLFKRPDIKHCNYREYKFNQLYVIITLIFDEVLMLHLCRLKNNETKEVIYTCSFMRLKIVYS